MVIMINIKAANDIRLIIITITHPINPSAIQSFPLSIATESENIKTKIPNNIDVV